MKQHLPVVGTAAFLILAAACIGTVHRDPRAETVALAPERVIELPLRASRPYWLLLQEPGWAGSHEARFGGGQHDQGSVVVRIARFESAAAAGAASRRLTPDYLYRMAKSHILAPPAPAPEITWQENLTIHSSVALIRRSGSEDRETAQSSFHSLQSGKLVVLIECDDRARATLDDVVAALLEAADPFDATD